MLSDMGDTHLADAPAGDQSVALVAASVPPEWIELIQQDVPVWTREHRIAVYRLMGYTVPD